MSSVRQIRDLLGTHAADLVSFKPLLWPAADDATMTALVDLHREGKIATYCDTLLMQLRELLDVRNPIVKLSNEDLTLRAQEYLNGVSPERYGTWVYYPWHSKLVHVLPEAEYRELRTSRNRNKITVEEQGVLRKLRIGVVGLSVGKSSVVTMAMEEIGNEYVLADYDELSLSNMNRLRAGVYDINVNKAVLTAREITELNPYAKVEVFTEGLTETNIDAFLSGSRPLDVLVEECDDFVMKVMVRERARAMKIPVLMETSDRGLFDIERFDKEPQRPLFHGLIKNLDTKRFRGKSSLDKLPVAFEIIGGENMSSRLAASVVEMDSTIKTWPQLASAVTLGAAVNTDALRRMVLGEFTESGRFYVDLDKIVSNGAGIAAHPKSSMVEISSEALANISLPTVRRSHTERLTQEQVQTLVSYAIMAPSGGNAQAWRFVFKDNRLYCYFVRERSGVFLDYKDLASYLAFGAVAENIDLVCEQLGLKAEFSLLPDAAHPELAMVVSFAPSVEPALNTELFNAIAKRLTNRKIGPRQPLTAGDDQRMCADAKVRGGRLQWLTEATQLEAMADILGPGDRLRFVSKVMHPELIHEIRWSPVEVEQTRDGIDVATLELSAVDLIGLRLASSMGVMDLVGKVGGGRSLEKPARKMIASASAVGLITCSGEHNFRSMIAGGRAMQRVWLRATALGYSFQPMTALICLFWRLLDGAPNLKPREKEVLEELRAQYLKLFDVTHHDAEIMLFRIARVEPPTAHSLRLKVQEVLTFEG